MLRFSRRTKNKSAHEELAGNFDWNKTPLAPIGTKSLIFDDPQVRGTWAPHGTDCFYIGPAPMHYRCLRFWCPASRRIRVGDTFQLYPTHCAVPTLSEHDRTLLAADNIIQCHDLQITPDTRHKLEHATVIQQLQQLLVPPPRVALTTERAPPRVTPTTQPTIPGGPPRVTFAHPTAKEERHQTSHTHQYNTCAIANPRKHGRHNTGTSVETTHLPYQQTHQTPHPYNGQPALQSKARNSTQMPQSTHSTTK